MPRPSSSSSSSARFILRSMFVTGVHTPGFGALRDRLREVGRDAEGVELGPAPPAGFGAARPSAAWMAAGSDEPWWQTRSSWLRSHVVFFASERCRRPRRWAALSFSSGLRRRRRRGRSRRGAGGGEELAVAAGVGIVGRAGAMPRAQNGAPARAAEGWRGEDPSQNGCLG